MKKPNIELVKHFCNQWLQGELTSDQAMTEIAAVVCNYHFLEIPEFDRAFAQGFDAISGMISSITGIAKQ